MCAGCLIEQLTEEKYECMVCCDIIRVMAPVWSCQSCFHVFHLNCIKKWARSPASQADGIICLNGVTVYYAVLIYSSFLFKEAKPRMKFSCSLYHASVLQRVARAGVVRRAKMWPSSYRACTAAFVVKNYCFLLNCVLACLLIASTYI